MPLDIVMYHYVRNNEDNYFDTYCRRKEEFEAQINFFVKSSKIINPLDEKEINFYLKSKKERAFLLTFDDGYIDHLYCAEFLSSKNLSGYFFPPLNVINGELLDVNGVHVLIGKNDSLLEKIISEIIKICLENNFKLVKNSKEIDIDNYLNNFNCSSRYDDKNTLIIKRILQRDLIDEKNRKYILDLLLEIFIGKKSSLIAKDLYLNIEQMIKMKEMGMCFGSHGNTHRWLNYLSAKNQKEEIRKSFTSLINLNLIDNNKIKFFCYPYGGYNKKSLELLSEHNINFAVTTEFGSSSFNKEKFYNLKLPRWDTNDFWDNKWRKPCNPF